jgi:two-component system OmpR family sensor kinase
MVGAQSASLYDRDGDLLASYGEIPDEDDEASDDAGGDLRFDLKSGGHLVVRSATYSPLFGADRIPLLKSFGDLADLALARCAAISREREFISNAAHELRTPLTTMTGLGAILAVDRDRMSDAQIEECIGGIVRQGNRARELVNTLLDMAQIERGSALFADDPIDLSDVVSNALDFTPAPTDRRIHVGIADDVRVRGDAARLQQVIVNLVTNAYRYGGTEISIDAETNGSDVVLSVADNGKGVPNDLVPKLFDPFSRAVTAHGIGSGLGLAICRTIVDALGGSISYDPAPDGGARFKVELRKAA